MNSFLKIEESLTYSDVLIKPNFSKIRSRNEVSLSQNFLGIKLDIPIIASNMDTVSSPKMSATLSSLGAVAALHRFQSVEENIQQFYDSVDLAANNKLVSSNNVKPIVSFGVGELEYERSVALVEAGAKVLLLDVAHGASIQVVEQYDKVRSRVPDYVSIIVGNFDNYPSLSEFLDNIKSERKPDAIKVGIGNGGACTTRVVTGCGGGMISALRDCSKANIPMIADGGIKTSGDIAKALAAGASVVMVGSLLAGTDESPGQVIEDRTLNMPIYKTYRGSASKESYAAQNKLASHRAPEGESMLVPYRGSAKELIETLSAGIKSAFSYVGARDMEEFKKKVELVKASISTIDENFAHSKKV